MKNELVLGWREWVGLPDWGISAIKAKVDTGARTSSLHALDAEPFALKGAPFVRFLLLPVQRSLAMTQEIVAPVVDRRRVKSSTGQAQDRIVIRLALQLGPRLVETEATLANRRDMKFRMLLGRNSLQELIVRPEASYLLGKTQEQREFLLALRRELKGS